MSGKHTPNQLCTDSKLVNCCTLHRAAPDLLAACKAALQCQIDGLDENTVDAIEAAIARAEGRDT